MTDEDKKKSDEAEEEEVKKEEEEKPPVETQHSIKIGKKTLKYTATAGTLPIKNAESGEKEADIFFTSYTLDGVDDKSERPLIIAFNGGPGSSSVWLHLGALGPKRVKMQDEGWMPAPPFKLEDNEHTWLDKADLVFIDPVGTGYSRATKPEHNKKFWSLQGDLDSVGEFIRLFLTRYGRWSSPLFMAGESYGTTRAAGLAGLLIDKGIAFNGIFLISTVLNFQSLRFTRGNDLPFILYLPSYAATAHYHNKLADDLQQMPITDFLAKVEDWAETDYTLALAKGDRLTAEERHDIIVKLARYSGLDERYIDQTNLRIEHVHFCKELCRDEKKSVGRIDSRYKYRDMISVGETFEFDPSMAAIIPPYTSTFNDYIRSALGYESDLVYEILSMAVNRGWEYDGGRFPDTSEALREALAKNRYLKVYMGRGYYDLATPHFAAQYTMNHMDLSAETLENIKVYDYEAGHMYYVDIGLLGKLKEDVVEFLEFAL